MTGQQLTNCRPCPHCGGSSLSIVERFEADNGPYMHDAVECRKCKASAPIAVWNMRNDALTDADRAAIAQIVIDSGLRLSKSGE